MGTKLLTKDKGLVEFALPDCPTCRKQPLTDFVTVMCDCQPTSETLEQYVRRCKANDQIELWENGKPKGAAPPTWFCANCDAETTTAKCNQCGRLCGPPLPRKRVYRAHGATVMDEDGGFSVGYGVDVHRAKMIADALNVPNDQHED